MKRDKDKTKEQLISELEDMRQRTSQMETQEANRRQTEARLSRLYEILLTTRKINQLIVGVDNESELLERACAILVGGRSYKISWIGFTQEGSYDVVPVAQAGFEAGYLQSVKITWDDSEYGKGPTGTAIKTKSPSVMQDITHDERCRPWRQQALERGYLSSAAFPLVVDDKVIGALNVYSGIPDAFDNTEVDMLVELAADISVGIQKIRQRQALRKSEERYRSTLDSMLEGCQIIGFDWRYLYVNDAVARHGRQRKEDLLGHTMMEVYPGIEDTEMFAHLRRCMENRTSHRMRNEFTYPDGDKGWFELSIEPVPEGIFILSLDITERERTEEALRESEKRYRDLFDNANDLIQSVAPDGRLLYVNKAWQQVLGYSAKEIPNLNIWDIIHHDSKAHCMEIFQKVMAGEAVSNIEAIFVAKDGKSIFVEGNVHCRFEDGNPASTQGFFRDVSKRKRAEEASRESEERFRAIFDNTVDGILLADLETKRFYTGNKAICQMLGYSLEEIRNLGVAYIHPERDLPYVIEQFEKQSRREISLSGDIPVKRKDGSVFFAEVSSSPVTIAGKAYLIGIFRDTTERKQAEEQLRKLYQAVEQSPAIVMVTNTKSTIEYVNPKFTKVTGYTRQEILGTSAEALGEPSHQQVKQMWAALNSGKEWNGEFLNRKKNGELYWESASISPVKDRNGNTTHFVKVAEDTTERRKMEEQLIITDRLASVGELAAGIAHELNNPLTSVIGFSDLLLQKDMPGDVREDLQVVNREARRTADIIKNLLTFARRHEAGKTPTDINKVIENVLALRAYEQKVHNIEVKADLAPDLPEITADGFKLQQVFLNIIINAEYFMTKAHGKGTLTINTKRVGDTVRVSFTDDGPGIPEENLARLFDPFFTTKEVGVGTGLGLSISYGIITEHSGRIYAESKVGEGANFIVELPITK